MVKKLLTYFVMIGMITALGHALINNNQPLKTQVALTYIAGVETYGNELLPEIQETIANFDPENYNQELEYWTFDVDEEADGITQTLAKIANGIGTLITYTVETFRNIMKLSISLLKSIGYTFKIIGSIVKTIWYFLYGEIV